MSLTPIIAEAIAALEQATKANTELRARLKQLQAILELLEMGKLDPDRATNLRLREALYEAQQSLRIDASSTALAIIDAALAGKGET